MNVALKRVCWGVAVLLIGSYLLYSLRGPDGVAAVFERQRQIRALEEQNANLAREIQQKKDRVRRLEQDRTEQELEVRRRLKLLKDKETTFLIPEKAPEKGTDAFISK